MQLKGSFYDLNTFDSRPLLDLVHYDPSLVTVSLFRRYLTAKDALGMTEVEVEGITNVVKINKRPKSRTKKPVS